MKKNILILVGFVFSGPAIAQGQKTIKNNGRTYNFNFYNDGDVDKSTVPITSKAPVVTPVVAPATVSVDKKTDPEKLKRSGVAFIGGYFSKNYSASTRKSEGEPFLLLDLEIMTRHSLARLDSYRGLSLGMSFISSYDFSIEPRFMIGKMRAKYVGSSELNFEGKVPGLRVDFRNKYWITDNFGLFLGLGLYGYTGKLKESRNPKSYYHVFDDPEEIRVRGFGADLNIGPVVQLGSVFLDGGVGYGLESSQLSGYGDDVTLRHLNLQANLSIRI